MIPMVLRTTEEMIKLVPNSLREAALALGYPRWRTSLSVVIRTTLPGIVTGALLATARIAGETAPLLFTALGSQYLSFNLNQPMAALPLTVFTYATGPYEEWHQLRLGRGAGADPGGVRLEPGRAARHPPAVHQWLSLP